MVEPEMEGDQMRPGGRRLAAILSADVVGYSRVMALDEDGAVRTLRAYRTVISDLVAEHDGRIFGTAGDSVIAEFASAVQAVRSAVAIQRALDRHNADQRADRRMDFRIGINVGDVLTEGDDLLGDGVNIAARLQEIAAPAGICISGQVFDQIEGKLTFNLKHLGAKSLKNLTRAVQVYEVDWSTDDAAMPVDRSKPLTLPKKPSIAVLPFTNSSHDPEQEFFVDGITDDLITVLSHYRWFFVIARNSSFAYKGRSIDAKQVAQELGVRYILEGSVRRAGSRVRINGQLVDAESGNHLWAERYELDLSDIFAVQDEITQSVVAAIEPELLMAEGQRAIRRPPANLDAFECYQRGMWHFHQFTSGDNREAETWLRRAIELDPTFAQGWMGLARVLNASIWFGWSQDVERDRLEGYAAAHRGVDLDNRDPYCFYALTLHRLISREQVKALESAQRAIDLTPNFAVGHFSLGWARIFTGRFASAVDPLHRAMRLSPHDPINFSYLNALALAHYHQGEYERALAYANRSYGLRRLYNTGRTLLACLGQLGLREEAEKVRAEVIELTLPEHDRFWALTNPYLNPDHVAHLREGLRLAGLEADLTE
ncbi:MAG TPA: adenylate/guanylate cyclase domain-containing protein [Microvirga sp.]|nr:adenylate/guanylate cyclase domain-containing protein [Microvirga sp.]